MRQNRAVFGYAIASIAQYGSGEPLGAAGDARIGTYRLVRHFCHVYRILVQPEPRARVPAPKASQEVWGSPDLACVVPGAVPGRLARHPFPIPLC